MRANGWTRSVLLAGFMLFTAAAFAEPDLDSRTALVDKLMAELKVVQAEVTRTAKTIEEIDATVDQVIRVDEKDKQQVLAELADKIRVQVTSLEDAAEQTAWIGRSLDALAATASGEIRPGKRIGSASRYPVFELRLRHAYQALKQVDGQIERAGSRASDVLQKIRDAQTFSIGGGADRIG